MGEWRREINQNHFHLWKYCQHTELLGRKPVYGDVFHVVVKSWKEHPTLHDVLTS